MSEVNKLLVATKNAHKTEEIRAMLGGRWEVSDLTVIPDYATPLETGLTFQDNAAIKALEASRCFEGLVLADDSGLEVDALGGAPGVYSARFAGPRATDADNRKKLLEEMQWFGAKTSLARFQCVLVVAKGGKVLAAFDGSVEGKVINQERGADGFGYDSMFIPNGYQQTFAELSAEVKNQLSHRSKAMAKLIAYL